MFSIIGIVVVFGCIAAGYLMEHGNMKVLAQPAELIIIGGAALGTVLISNPIHTLKQMIGGLIGAFGSSKYGTKRYIDSLKMMYELLQKARKEGLVALDADMEVHHHEASEPVAALSTMADALPGLGIVAAVLGVVITMGALGGPPEEIGRKVAAALVGTFLGILLCYGLVGPLAANMAKTADEEHAYYHVLRVMLVSLLKGINPGVAIEIGRRAIPSHLRPSFQEA